MEVDGVDDFLASLEADFQQELQIKDTTIIEAAPLRFCEPCEGGEESPQQTGPVHGFSMCHTPDAPHDTSIRFRCYECSLFIERPVLCQGCRVLVYW
jgi:hypothetical protein